MFEHLKISVFRVLFLKWLWSCFQQPTDTSKWNCANRNTAAFIHPTIWIIYSQLVATRADDAHYFKHLFIRVRWPDVYLFHTRQNVRVLALACNCCSSRKHYPFQPTPTHKTPLFPSASPAISSRAQMGAAKYKFLINIWFDAPDINITFLRGTKLYSVTGVMVLRYGINSNKHTISWGTCFLLLLLCGVELRREEHKHAKVSLDTTAPRCHTRTVWVACSPAALRRVSF